MPTETRSAARILDVRAMLSPQHEAAKKREYNQRVVLSLVFSTTGREGLAYCFPIIRSGSQIGGQTPTLNIMHMNHAPQ